MVLGSWQAVEGASYYRVYHADHMTADCRLETGGVSGSCELLEDNISGTSYTDANPDQKDNYYWVVACNSTGCSDIDSDRPEQAWAAADFLARHHVIDGALGIHVRVGSDCTEDCESEIFPGDGSRDLGAIKAVTGVDLGLMNPGRKRAATWYLDRMSDGRIANARLVLTNQDIETAHENGEHAVMFYLQRRPTSRGWLLEGDVTNLRHWYADGLTVLQLAYGSGREDARTPDERLGYGHSEGEHEGLTELGRAAIAEMNALGMVIDVSHSSRQTTLDAAALSTKPIIATHANAEALTPRTRNKDDEELMAIAGTGGVIGVTPIRRMLDRDGDRIAGMDDMIAHIEYIVDLVGIDHVGVATDARMNGWPKTSHYYSDADLAALDRWVLLASRLYARGWSEEDLAKLLGGNFRRVFSEVLPAG